MTLLRSFLFTDALRLDLDGQLLDIPRFNQARKTLAMHEGTP